MATVMAEALGARVGYHPTGEDYIGFGRRHSVALALELGAEPDHLRRPRPHAALAQRRAGRAQCRAVGAAPDTGLLIVGRSPRAFAPRVPERLQQTERADQPRLRTRHRPPRRPALRRPPLQSRRRPRYRHHRPPVDSFANDVARPAGSSGWPHRRLHGCRWPALPHHRAVLGRRRRLATATRCNGCAASRWPPSRPASCAELLAERRLTTPSPPP